MSARLTTYSRNAFIQAVMDDVPLVDYSEQAREKVQKFALSKLPAGVAAALKAFPDWFDVKAYISLPGVLANCYVVHRNRDELDKLLKADKKLWPELEAMAKAASAQAATRQALREKVKALAYSCTTVSALQTKAPEFAKYISGASAPVDRSVPVVQNIVADLVAAGWPKGKKPATRKAQAAK
jgi:hypothetical protein